MITSKCDFADYADFYQVTCGNEDDEVLGYATSRVEAYQLALKAFDMYGDSTEVTISRYHMEGDRKRYDSLENTFYGNDLYE